MFKFDKLVFGDAGWGDEFLIATLMTLLVSILSDIKSHNGKIIKKSLRFHV